MKPGHAFRRARVAADLTLRDVAGRLGISTVRLGEFERGVETPLDWEPFYHAIGSEMPSEEDALRQRIKTLENHRMTWWRRAWYAHDIIGRTDPAKAEELVRDWDREVPSLSGGPER